jgi:hypothetical protein
LVHFCFHPGRTNPASVLEHRPRRRLKRADGGCAVEHANTPETNAKKAAAARCRPPSAKTRKALAESRKKLNAPEVRRNVSEAHRRRGTIPPAGGWLWTPEEDALILMMPAAMAARRTRRTIFALQ